MSESKNWKDGPSRGGLASAHRLDERFSCTERAKGLAVAAAYSWSTPTGGQTAATGLRLSGSHWVSILNAGGVHVPPEADVSSSSSTTAGRRAALTGSAVWVALRSLSSPVRHLPSVVNVGARFSEGAVWARFESRPVAIPDMRHEHAKAANPQVRD